MSIATITFLMQLFSLFLFTFSFFRLLPSLFRSRHRRQFSENLSGGNSPPSYPILGCLISFYQNRYRLLDWYTELLTHSPTQTISIRRLGATPTIITANPENVEYILKTRFDNFPKGKPFTDILGDLLGKGIFNVDGELWRTQRKAASHEFSARSLRELVLTTLETEANERLLPLLELVSLSKKSIDMQDVLGRFTFDTICKISFGTDPGCLVPSMPVSPLARALDVAAGISARRGAAPVSAIWKTKRALGIGSERQLRDAVELVHGLVTEMVRKSAERTISSTVSGQDLLSRYVAGGNGEEEARDMVISFMMAGKDTTSAALTWLFWLLTQHPEIQEEAVQEVMEREENLGFGDLKEMRFLQACICESMRLYPPVAWDSKHAVKDDLLPDGTFVGRGNRVTYFPYGMGRMESIWGKDCLEFRPHRWLDLEENSGGFPVTSASSTYKFPVFQGGPRVCLGKEMAFIQMKYVAATVLRRFVLEPVNVNNNPVYVPLLTAHMAGGLHVLVHPRKL